MLIIHCLTRAAWEASAGQTHYGADLARRDGFIHCSEPESFKAVAPNFSGCREPLLLLCIDTRKVAAEIRFEDGGSGALYPHIYGPLNTDAVIGALPFLTDETGAWLPNPEFETILEG